MKFRAAIGLYIRDQQSLGRINSPNTVRVYVSRLNILADHIGNRDPRTVGRNDIKRTLQQWGPSSQAHARSIYISFFDWCEQEGHIEHANPARKTPRPNVKPVERYKLTVDETRLIAAAASSVREKRAVHLAVFAGLRNQELRGLQGRHFQRDGWIWVSRDIAKGSRERWLPVLPALEPVVAEIRQNVPADHYVLPALRWNDRLATHQREIGARPSSSSALCGLVKKVAKRAGIAADIAPHTLRHAFCDHVRRATGDVAITQALMGHKNIATTQGYMSRPSLDELADALGVSYPPENGAERPATARLAANRSSHSVAAPSDPLFWLGVRLGSQVQAIEAYREAFTRA